MPDIHLQLETIVRKIAESDSTDRAGYCCFCRCYLEHNPTCVWRMALDWVLANKPTPTHKCYRCKGLIGPKDAINRYMISGEEVWVHRQCPPKAT